MSTARSADGTTIAFTTTGSGPGVIVVGGALRTAEDYRPLAAALAASCTVHVVDRRGRGASGPQGPDYSMRKEVEDLEAVRVATGARLVFGHSYGGIVALETAREHASFARIAAYEPGPPSDPFPMAWAEPYRRSLAAGDPRGALVHFVKGSGGAPAFLAKAPGWYLRLVMRIVFRGDTWRRTEPLLAANLAEHEQVAALQGQVGMYDGVATPVLLLAGSRSRGDFEPLRAELPNATLETLRGLDHFGPEGRTAPVVAQRALAFLLA